MANKTIPLRDKQLILKRLAEGQSTRQAIKGTSMASNSSAASLARRELHTIAQYKKNYLWGIEQENALGAAERARLWAEMAHAMKNEVVAYAYERNGLTDRVSQVPIIDQVPDWKTRAVALRYIDNLCEQVNKSDSAQKVQVNFIKDSQDFSVINA